MVEQKIILILITKTPITKIFIDNVALRINVIAPYKIGAPSKQNQKIVMYKS